MFKHDLLSYPVQKKFTSKKNDVYLVSTSPQCGKCQYLVYKKYSCSKRMQGEVEMLCLLKDKGLPVPQVLGKGDDCIWLEYLEGPLLLDCFCSQESISGSSSTTLHEATYQSIYALCCWFKEFYNVVWDIQGKQLIMGDVNFRNFIVKDKVYAIDFEECREGSIEEEVGSLCAFALTYKPSFTLWKIAMVRELLRVFINEFNLDQMLLKEQIINQLQFLARIRGNKNEIDGILASNVLENII